MHHSEVSAPDFFELVVGILVRPDICAGVKNAELVGARQICLPKIIFELEGAAQKGRKIWTNHFYQLAESPNPSRVG